MPVIPAAPPGAAGYLCPLRFTNGRPRDEREAEGQHKSCETRGAGKPASSASGHIGLSHFQLAIAVLDLRQRGMAVIVAENVSVEQFTVFARHFQRGMAEQLLERESVFPHNQADISARRYDGKDEWRSFPRRANGYNAGWRRSNSVRAFDGCTHWGINNHHLCPCGSPA